MPLVQLDSENADRNLTSQVTVLTHTPSVTEHRQCQAYIAFGDGSKDLDGSGGDFEITVTVGGQTVQPSPQTIAFGTAARAAVWTTPFPVPANSEVVVKVKSPNAADTDVDLTVRLFDIPVGDVQQLGGNSQSLADLKDFAESGYDPSTHQVEACKALSAAERNTVADAVLSRDVSYVEAAAPEHSLCTIILATLESSIAGTTWTIKQTDGSTTHATKTVTTSANASAITGVS